MENKKLENQKISDNNAANVAGGTKIHVDTTTPLLSRVDSIYMSKNDYDALKNAGAIDKDNKLDISKMPEDSNIQLDNLNKMQLTTKKPGPGEVKVKISNPIFNIPSFPFKF